MAISKFSELYNISKPVDSVNDELLLGVIGDQQTKYDAGYLALSNTLDAYKTAGLVAEKDQEYVNSKVAALTDQLDGYGNSNLADPKIVARLNSEAKSLSTDKEFMGMVSSQKNYQQLLKRYEDLKSDPKKNFAYNQMNEILDMQEVDKWRKGESKFLNISSPTLNYDVDKLSETAAKTLKANIFSRKEGGYLLDGKIKTADDNYTVIANTIDGDPRAQQQLFRNAKVMFMNSTPEQIKELSLRNNTQQISALSADIEFKEKQLLRADVTLEQKDDLKRGVDQMKAKLNGIINTNSTLAQSNIDSATAEQLAYSLYKDNYIKGIAQKHVVNDFTLKADPFSMEDYKHANSMAKQKAQFIHSDQQQQRTLDAANQKAQQESYFKMLEITGGNKESQDLFAKGDFAGAIAAANKSNQTFVPLSTVQTADEPFTKIQSDISELRGENSKLANKMVMDVLKLQDPTTLHAVKNILSTQGNVTEYLKSNPKLSPKVLSTLVEYSKIQDKLATPDELTVELLNNPLMQENGRYQNEMLTNSYRIQALERLQKPSYDNVFKELQKEGKVKDRQEFNDIISGKLKDSPTSWNSSLPGQRIEQSNPGKIENTKNAIRERVSASLRKNKAYTQYNEFSMLQTVGPTDKVWNSDATGKRTGAIELLKQSGIVIDGSGIKGVNGFINGAKVERSGGSLENVDLDKATIKGFVDSKNRIYFSLPSTDKDTPPIEGYTELNEATYRGLRGTSSSDVKRKSFEQDLLNGGGQMKNAAGFQEYFNLNGVIPKMGGNVKYAFDLFEPGEFVTSVRFPVGGKQTIGTFKSKDDADDFLIGRYKEVKNYTESLLRQNNPNVSNLEVEKQTLNNFYKMLSNGNK